MTAANWRPHALTEHLIDRGHARIGFVAAAASWPMIEERYAGYRDALATRREPAVASSSCFAAGGTAAGDAGWPTPLFELGEPPTAIMAANDLLAIGVMHALRLRARRIPEDLAVSGFNDFGFSAFVDPAFTTVSIPVYEMGARRPRRSSTS